MPARQGDQRTAADRLARSAQRRCWIIADTFVLAASILSARATRAFMAKIAHRSLVA
jgi:hypothetical protein